MRLANRTSLFDVVAALRLDPAWGNMIGAVITDGLSFTMQAKTTLQSLEKPAHYFAARGDFHMNALVAFSVDDGVDLAVFVVEVLGYV